MSVRHCRQSYLHDELLQLPLSLGIKLIYVEVDFIIVIVNNFRLANDLHGTRQQPLWQEID